MLVVIEVSDVIFAVDSIPAIFGVTREPFIVFSATAFALVGLRSLYFLLAGARDRFVYLDYGLAAILIFIGAKFVLTEVVHISVGVSLLVILVVMGTAIVASLQHPAGTPNSGPKGSARSPTRKCNGTALRLVSGYGSNPLAGHARSVRCPQRRRGAQQITRWDARRSARRTEKR